MATTTYPNFNAQTEATEVAQAFSTNIKGKTILVTGVNKLGLGFATVQALASQSPKCIILAGRCPRKQEECLVSLIEYPDVQFRTLLVDLSSQTSVQRAAEEMMSWDDVEGIDIVINNAGVMMLPERRLSEDGFEMHFATNHVGHFLLTNLIMPKIIAAAKTNPPGATRIVNVSSLASMVSPLRASDVNWEKPTKELLEKEKPNIAVMKMSGLQVDEGMSYIPMGAYGTSKCANSLFTVALNKRLHDRHGILSVVLHPGEIESELQRHVDKEWIDKAHKAMKIVPKTPQQGASTTLVAAMDPKLRPVTDEGKRFYLNDCQVWTKLLPHVIDPIDAEKLWDLSEDIVKEKFAW